MVHLLSRSDLGPSLAKWLTLGGIAGLLVVLAVLTPQASWHPVPLFVVLLAFATFTYAVYPAAGTSGRYSGTSFAILLTAAFLGPVPAASLGIASEIIVWLAERYRLRALFVSAMSHGWAGLLAGFAFMALKEATGVTSDSTSFYFAIIPIGAFSLFINGLTCLLVPLWDGVTVRTMLNDIKAMLAPAIATIGLTVVVAAAFQSFGLIGLSMLALPLLGTHLMKMQLRHRKRSLNLAERGLSALIVSLRTGNLRDTDAARHSAAVARYARETASQLGWPKDLQELAHTAGLLHDLGKFPLPDRILRSKHALAPGDWTLVKSHPEVGASLLRTLPGYGDVADIVLSHHERLDGCGYPQGLTGEDIPEISRLIAVAEAYDAMTSASCYGRTRSSFEAILELRRCSGSQFDERFVDAFASTLAGEDLSLRHGADADFDSELELERRVKEIVEAVPAQPYGLK